MKTTREVAVTRGACAEMTRGDDGGESATPQRRHAGRVLKKIRNAARARDGVGMHSCDPLLEGLASIVVQVKASWMASDIRVHQRRP